MGVVKIEKAVMLTWLAVVVLSAAVKGWVLTYLWGWFIMPVFEVSRLSVPHAIGFMLFANMLIPQIPKDHSGKTLDELIGQAIGYAFVGPIMALIIGWLLKGLI